MKKGILLTGIGFAAVGIVLMTAGIASGALDQKRYFSQLELQEETIDLAQLDTFTAVRCVLDCADVTILPSEDGTACVAAENVPEHALTVTSKNGVLDITLSNQKKWYQNISLGFTTPETTLVITLPQQTYESIAVALDLGKLELQGLTASGSIELEADCGDLTIQDCESAALMLSADLGKLTANRLTVADRLDVTNNCGKTVLDSIDASSASRTAVYTDVGDTVFTGGSYRNLTCQSDCGDVKFQKTSLLGDCDLRNATGNLEGKLLGKEEAYNIEASCDIGDVRINGHSGGMRSAEAIHAITMSCDCGDIEIDLEE